MRLIFNYRSLAYLVVFLLAIGCTDEVEEGTQPDTAEFTVDVNPENLLEISFTNLSEKATHYVWNFGDGSPLVYTENPTHVYESPGTYNVTLNARSRGGNKIKIMPLTVEGNEPPNLIQGGDMSDQSLWTVVSAGSTLTDHAFSNEAVTFSNGSGSAQTNIIFYTTVDVLAGRNYKFSAKVSGSGAINSWMQVYFGTMAPVDGVDYNEGMYTGLNTWDGCGAAAFTGNLAVLGCQGGGSGNGKAGAVTFPESGTIYIVFKVGSWDGNLGTDGITLDDVKLQETEQAQGPNLIAGGDMSSADAWEFYGAGSTLTTTEFKDGALTFSNGTESAQTNVLVWTEVEVEAGKTYAVSANVKGSGATNSWLELFFGTTAPVEGSDYSDGKYRALSTWGGCATSPFNGDLITVGCDGDGNGIITFETSGTIYVVIKSGSWDGNLGTEGITLDDLKLAELL